MVRKPHLLGRRGAGLVEFAFILPVLLLFTLGTMVFALGVFRQHQVAAFAREGARYAVVHGAQFRKEQGGTPLTADDIRTKVILPRAAGFDPSKIAVNVEWGPQLDKQSVPDVQAPEYLTTDGVPMVNRVRVTVKFAWVPEFWPFPRTSPLGAGPTFTLTSKAEMLMWY